MKTTLKAQKASYVCMYNGHFLPFAMDLWHKRACVSNIMISTNQSTVSRPYYYLTQVQWKNQDSRICFLLFKWPWEKCYINCQSHYIRGVVGKYLEHVSVSDGQLSSPGYRNLGLTWEISISKLMQDICSLIPKYKNTSRIKVIPMPTLVNILTPKNASINWTQIISLLRRWQ